MIKVVVFDFDDTLVYSERIKQDSFVQVFSFLPSAQEIATKYVNKNYGLPRYQMIKGILVELKKEGVLDLEVTKEIIDEYVQKFGDLVENKIINASATPGAIKLLNHLFPLYNLFINSSTPQDSISKIIQKRGWGNIFQSVLGSPPGSKIDNLQKIIDQEKVDPKEAVVIGDSKSDLDSAELLKTQFIGFNGEYSRWPKKNEFIIVDNLEDVLKILP